VRRSLADMKKHTCILFGIFSLHPGFPFLLRSFYHLKTKMNLHHTIIKVQFIPHKEHTVLPLYGTTVIAVEENGCSL
jgi:uncharacterized membrane protein (GlpM family)